MISFLTSFTEAFYEHYNAFELKFCRDFERLGFGLDVALGAMLTKVDGMRAAELRNFLLQELSARREVVDKILDRAELRILARDLIELRVLQQCRSSAFRLGVVIPLTAAFSLIALLVFSKTLKRYKPQLRFVLSHFVDADRFFQKTKLARRCKERGLFLGLCAIFLSLLLDLLIAWINISVLLSWVIPRYSPWRRWLFHGLSLPVDTNMVKGMVTGGKQKDEATMNAWSLDVGPMLTLIALRWICTKLDDFAAFQLYKSS